MKDQNEQLKNKKGGSIMKWRNSLLILLLITLTTVIAACGNDSTEKDKETSENEEEESNQTNGDYPSGNIQVIIPYGPGGDTDINARIISDFLTEELGVNVVPTNIEGGGGTVGIDELTRSEPDGHTVLFHHSSMLLLSMLGLTDTNFKDLENAGVIAEDSTNGLYVSSDSEFNNLEELIAYAKEHPGELTAAASMGNITHMLYLALEDMADIELNIVDVGGAQDQAVAVQSGRVDLFLNSYMSAESFVESGDFTPIGIFAEERNELLPDIPTIKEQGYDLVFPKMMFLQFPPDTPKDIVDTFTQALEKITQDENYANEIAEYFATPNYMSPEEAVETLTEDEEKYTQYKDLLKEE